MGALNTYLEFHRGFKSGITKGKNMGCKKKKKKKGNGRKR